MNVITFKDIASLGISPLQCYEWAETMIRNKRQAMLPAKISLKPMDGVFCNVMPGIIPTASGSVGGVKIVTRYPNRQPSLEARILLLNTETGEFLALMDGTWITTMRTGAVAAHSILLFAKSDFQTIGIMGLGNVSRAAIEVLSAKIPEREMHLKLLKYKGQEEDFQTRFASYPNIHFTFVDTPEQMVEGSDVVLSGATYLPQDVCEDKYFGEGVFVQPIHTRGFANCDLFFDKVFADDTGHVHHFKNFDKFRNFAEVCDVVNGYRPGREHDSERILAYNIGISIHDIHFAANIYNMILDAGGDVLSVDFEDPAEKFWV